MTKRKTALILAIFGGWFGVDAFYLGHIKRGLIKLFTFGGFGIMNIIDIVAMIKSDDDLVEYEAGYQEFADGYNQGKLESIQKNASKRCYRCDHYVAGTRTCKKHKKQIKDSLTEYCADWSDLRQSIKSNM